ncbi:hypothetical protein C4D60_Mb06t36580 [Musa balbisiana]|uniref:Uncharacterized protein n=1 Tax=Musa balbisiana TaxID=52838 RepID=A0A4S8IU24_MUSBA|nr:hypothetical protein C4D60_Mb06t36580 [Musa balbisiana]
MLRFPKNAKRPNTRIVYSLEATLSWLIWNIRLRSLVALNPLVFHIIGREATDDSTHGASESQLIYHYGSNNLKLVSIRRVIVG